MEWRPPNRKLTNSESENASKPVGSGYPSFPSARIALTSLLIFFHILWLLARSKIKNPRSWGGLEAELSSCDRVGCWRSLPYGLEVAWERQDDGAASGRRPVGAIPCNSQAAGEAALATDSITAWTAYKPPQLLGTSSKTPLSAKLSRCNHVLVQHSIVS